MSKLKKNVFRICLTAVLFLLIFMLPGVSQKASAQTRTVDYVEAELVDDCIIPFHGSNANDYYHNLNYTLTSDVPVTMISMRYWYKFFPDSDNYGSFDYNPSNPNYFDCNTYYKLELQVKLMKSANGDTYKFSDNAQIKIGELTFERSYKNVTEADEFYLYYFVAEEIRPRLIGIQDILITDSNCDDVLGDLDGDKSTVTFNKALNEITLDGANLTPVKDGTCHQYVFNPEYDPLDNDMPASITSLNCPLNIRLKGENFINPAGSMFSKETCITGIMVIPDGDYCFDLSIYGDGKLTITLDGKDTEVSEYSPDSIWLRGVDAEHVTVRDATLDIILKNAEKAGGITYWENGSATICGNADITVSEENINTASYAISCGNFYFNDVPEQVFIRNNAKVRARFSSQESIGIRTGDLEISDNAMLSLTNPWSALEATKHLVFSNHEGTALVNTVSTPKGRVLWDSEVNPDLTGYKHVRIPALPKVEAKPATETESGNIEYYYDELYDKYYSDITGNNEIAEADIVIPPTGTPDHDHVWDEEGTVTKDPTCGEPGTKTFTCTVTGCDQTKTEEIPATGQHTFGDWTVTTPASYTAAGKKERVCSVCGTSEQEAIAKLVPASIAKAAVTGISAKVYSGKALTQTPVVKLGGKTLKAGTDYTLSYKNNTAVGTAAVIITGKTAYTGSITKTFDINPQGTALTKLVKGKKLFTVKWKKQAVQTTGYQIQYGLKSNFSGAKTVTVSKSGTVSKKIKKLKAKKKYYVRIRTYKKIGSRTYYSAWSAAKSVKTK